jgi:hypothetical protein
MHRHPANGQIRPKVSTMPRPQSEAAAFLDIYKLVIEKKRLQQELQTIDQRRDQILNRLAVLENQVTALEKNAQQIRSTTAHLMGNPAIGSSEQSHRSPQTDDSLDGFSLLFLEY